ncbi:hypothetical protein BDR03DRAFT_964706 [Suillus americanus]|nr:hypothetical protein BDR03DRAFT_964706 [Suillus americanus]
MTIHHRFIMVCLTSSLLLITPACVSDLCYGLGRHLGRHSDPLLLYGCWNMMTVSNHGENGV